MKTISKYAVSAALLLTVASGLAYAQQSTTPPQPPASQEVADNGPGPDGCMGQGMGEGMDEGMGWRRHGRHHGKHEQMGEMDRGGPGGRAGMRGPMVIDANGDGFIGPDEAAALADGMFMRLDRNHDNVIDEAEATDGPGKHGWRRWLGQQQADDLTTKLKAAFAERDADKDGKVTKQEFMAFAQNRYASLDTAKDGKVSPWVFRAQPKL